MISIEQLVSLEQQLWRNDPVIYESTLVPEAALVFAETGMILRARAVEAIRQENAEHRRWADVTFTNVHMSRLVDDAILLHYRVTARWEHEDTPIVALASSVYVRRDDGWKLAFHQQTETQG